MYLFYEFRRSVMKEDFYNTIHIICKNNLDRFKFSSFFTVFIGNIQGWQAVMLTIMNSRATVYTPPPTQTHTKARGGKLLVQ